MYIFILYFPMIFSTNDDLCISQNVEYMHSVHCR